MKIRRLTIIFTFLILVLMCSAIIALAESPNITSFSSEEKVINDTVGVEGKFKIKINQTVNVSWLINGAEAQKNESIVEASYINKSAVEGNWNITAIAENQNGTATQMWIWNVAQKPSIVSPMVSTLTKPMPLWIPMVLLIIIVIYTALFKIMLTAGHRDRGYDEIERENKSLRKGIKEREKEIMQKEDENKKYKGEIRRMREDYEEYETNKTKTEVFREKCLGEFKEIGLRGKKIKEKTTEDIADIDPFREEEGEALGAAFREYFRLISFIKAVLKGKEQVYWEEKTKSHELIEKLEKRGIDVELYKKLLEGSNVEGLKVLHSSLNYVNERLGEKEFDSKTIKRLKETREKIDMIGDWGIKIVPSQLLDFCEKLIKETSLPEEVYPREKTVETILDLINEMYVK